MSKQIEATGFMVGAGVIAGGAVVTGVGFLGVVATPLPMFVIGAGLIAAGLLVILRAASLSAVRAMTVAVILAATGVVMTVLGATLQTVSATIPVAATGGSFFVAGIVEIMDAAAALGHRRRPRTWSLPGWRSIRRPDAGPEH